MMTAFSNNWEDDDNNEGAIVKTEPTQYKADYLGIQDAF